MSRIGASGETVRHIFWIAGFLIGAAHAAEPQGPAQSSLAYCDPAIVASASPAPAASDTHSLEGIAFWADGKPASAAVVVSFTPDYHPIIECVVFPVDDQEFEYDAIDPILGIVFSAPLAVNHASLNGRYIVRVSTAVGKTWVEPPPKFPLLPVCDVQQWRTFWSLPEAPRPASRVQPVYPDRALFDQVEGEVVIVMDIFSNGDAIPNCMTGGTPPGWFEDAALTAAAQWRFEKDVKRGRYSVTFRFKLEE